MSDFVFLFDLDATVTRQEILPEIATNVGCYDKMRVLTEETMLGRLPFHASFLQRVELLKEVPVSQISKQVQNIGVHQKIVEFLCENKDRCYIVTGNLDCWIGELIDKIHMSQHCYSSKGEVIDDKLVRVSHVIDKYEVAQQMRRQFPNLVAIGDGNNDAEMIDLAKIGIGFGAIRPIAPAVMDKAQYAIYEEDKLCQLLRRLL